MIAKITRLPGHFPTMGHHAVAAMLCLCAASALAQSSAEFSEEDVLRERAAQEQAAATIDLSEPGVGTDDAQEGEDEGGLLPGDEDASQYAPEAYAPGSAEDEQALDLPTVENAAPITNVFTSSYRATLKAAEEFFRQGDIGQALEAVRVAQDMVLESEGDSSELLILPTQVEARILFGDGQFLKAADAFNQVIALVESRDGMFSDDLIPPLTESAVAYREAGNHEQAVSNLRRAKFITHRESGIMNLEQVPIIDALTETLMGGRDFLEADREQRFAMQVFERRYGEEDAEVVDGIYRLARWYRRTGQYPRARALYRRAIGILEVAFGLDDMSLVTPLRGIAATYQLQGTRRGEGEKSLLRAIELFEKQEDNVDLVEYGENLIALGDWYLLSSKRKRAQEVYARAWRAIVDATGSLERAEIMLGVPTRLRYVPPHPSQFENIRWTTEEKVDRYVDAFFTVTAQGTVRDVEVDSTNAPHRVKREVRRAVGSARYRPRLVNGVPAETAGVQLRQVFFSD